MIELLLHSYGEFSPRQPLKRTMWPHYDLLFIHEGQLSIQVDNVGRVDLHAGEGILLFPETAFSPHGKKSKARASVQHFSLDAGGRNLPAPFDRLHMQGKGGIVYRGQDGDLLASDIERAMAWSRLPPTDARVTMRKALLTLILGNFLEVGWEGKPEQGAELSPKSLLEWAAHQPLAELSVVSLAAAAGISESTLRRQFREQSGMSPREAIVRLRFNEAKRLLTETAKPVKEIAMTIGYKSDIAFHTAFKNEYEMSPGAYRKKHRIAG